MHALNRTATTPRKRSPKIVFLTNIVAPYRIPLFQRLGEAFDTVVLCSSLESNRSAWKHSRSQITTCRVRQSLGFCLPFRQRLDDSVYEDRYLHITPGHFLDLLREKPEAVISIEMGFRTLVALLYTAIFRKPLWISWEGTRHTERNVRAWKLSIRRWLARRKVRWISYGNASTDYLTSLGVARNRILQIQNCVDESQFSPRGPARFPITPSPVVLSVGRLVGLKGFDRLIRAAAKVQAAGHEFSLLIVGEGPEEARLRRLTHELGLRNVHFRPNQPPEAMAEVYRSANVFIFPTLSDVWGLTVSEAMLCHLPVLCSVHAGCVEDIVPPENRFDPNNPGELEEALTRAVAGKPAAVDCSRLWSISEAANAIIADVSEVLGLSPCRREISTEATMCFAGSIAPAVRSTK